MCVGATTTRPLGPAAPWGERRRGPASSVVRGAGLGASALAAVFLFAAEVLRAAVFFLAAVFLLAAVFVLAPAVRAEAQWTRRFDVAHPAFHHDGAPDVIVHAPPRFDAARPLHLVVFLHGYSGCASVVAGEGEVACVPGGATHSGWGLLAAHDAAGTNTLLVIPQLALWTRDGRPGAFSRPGHVRRFLEDVLRALAPELGPGRTIEDVAALSLVAHSAGFETAAAVLRAGDVETFVRHVVLFDALYAGGPSFIAWAAAGDGTTAPRTLLSFYTTGRPAEQSRALAQSAARRLRGQVREGEADGLESTVGVTVGVLHARGGHGRVPMRYLAPTLRALGLPERSAGATR